MIAIIDIIGGAAGIFLVGCLLFLAVLAFLLPWFVYKIYQYAQAQLEAQNRIIEILWSQRHS